MANPRSWPNVLRLAHLAGGFRAENGIGPDVAFRPRLSGTPQGFELDEYHDLPKSLMDCGHTLIGLEYITDERQIRHLMPTEWRPYHRGIGGELVAKALQIWSDLGNAGHKKDDWKFVDLCRRVGFQLEVASMRLRELSDSYYFELAALIEDGDFRPGGRGLSLNSFQIGVAAQSILIELGTLRDYLAEFLAHYVFSAILKDHLNIRSMSLLRGALNSGESDVQFATYVRNLNHEGTWLREMSDYRNLVVHWTPLATAETYEFVRQSIWRSFDGAEFPALSFSLPSDPAAAKKLRKNAQSSVGLKEWLRKSFSEDGGPSGPDMLLYCHDVIGKMALFSYHVAQHSPMEPVPKVINATSSKGFRIRRPGG